MSDTTGMIEFASLAEFTRSVLQEILAWRFVRTNRKQWLAWVRRLNAATNFDIGGMVVFTRLSVLATACSKVVTAIRLPRTKWI
jgi:hypothetical protein